VTSAKVTSAKVTSAKVTSAFESWQVPRHSDLYVKLLTITSYVIIACLRYLRGLRPYMFELVVILVEY
jgi:hypothetical protein